MNLPSDPIILLSYINTQLRDKYSSFDQLCQDFNIKPEEISEKLSAVGYEYNAELNQFR